MDLSWPLVGRAAEFEQVSTLLRSRPGAAVPAGPTGLGKTRLATECLSIAAAQGFVPLRVPATQGAAGLPFGAYAALVPELQPRRDLLAVLRQIAQAVRRQGEGKPVAVFVDDAHLLDESSAALTHLLASTEQTFVLATIRSGEPAPAPVIALGKDGLAERLELDPLAIDEVEELLPVVLGGPVDGATLHLLHRRTEGNALFLREVVLGALQAGVLRREEEVWRLGGALPALVAAWSRGRPVPCRGPQLHGARRREDALRLVVWSLGGGVSLRCSLRRCAGSRDVPRKPSASSVRSSPMPTVTHSGHG